MDNGDLWIKELPDGSPRRLTTDGRTRRPLWSASGQWLTSSRDGQLRLVRVATGETVVLNGGAAVRGYTWSPVSDVLAYETEAGSLRVAATQPLAERTLVEAIAASTGGEARGPLWSPDGEWVAFARGDGEGGTGGLPGGLWRIKADGKDEEALLDRIPRATGEAPGGAEISALALLAAWTAADERILFWSDPRSASQLADGTSLLEIPADGGRPSEIIGTMLAYRSFLDLAPDGKSLVVARGAGRESWSHKRLVMVDLSSGRATGLTDESVSAIAPRWSPDGLRIAYVAAPDRGFLGGGEQARAAARARRIWIVNPSGSAKALTADSNYRDERPLWSAGGSEILFARLDDKDQASLWLIQATGLGARQVASLSPPPAWFGFFGHIDWAEHFDWWSGGLPEEDE